MHPTQAKQYIKSQDVGVLEDCERIVQGSIDALGGLDIIIANAVGASAPSLGPPFSFLCHLTLTFRDGRSFQTSVTLTL